MSSKIPYFEGSNPVFTWSTHLRLPWVGVQGDRLETNSSFCLFRSSLSTSVLLTLPDNNESFHPPMLARLLLWCTSPSTIDIKHHSRKDK